MPTLTTHSERTDQMDLRRGATSEISDSNYDAPASARTEASNNSHIDPVESPAIVSFSMSDGPSVSNLAVDNGSYFQEAAGGSMFRLDGRGKKHQCPQCPKRFNRPSSLRIHVNTHTGARRT